MPPREPKAWVPMRCTKTDRSLVGTFVQQHGSWNLQLLVGASEDAARSARRGSVRLEGGMGVAVGYPGCPGCRADSYVQCGACRSLSCYRSTDEIFRCGWCSEGGVVSGSIESISALDRS